MTLLHISAKAGIERLFRISQIVCGGKMRRHVAVRAAILLFAFNMAAGVAQTSGDGREHFTGAWKLVTLERPGPDGQIHRVDCDGMFVFTADGHASVQVMERASAAQTAKNGPEQYSKGGYEASYGSYVVDEEHQTFAFHVEGALVNTLIGKDLRRRYEFKGDQMIVQSTNPDEHWRVVWRHY